MLRDTSFKTASPIGMTLRVVDSLEMVDVDEQESERRIVALRKQELTQQAVVEVPTIVQARQRITLREVE